MRGRGWLLLLTGCQAPLQGAWAPDDSELEVCPHAWPPPVVWGGEGLEDKPSLRLAQRAVDRWHHAGPWRRPCVQDVRVTPGTLGWEWFPDSEHLEIHADSPSPSNATHLGLLHAWLSRDAESDQAGALRISPPGTEGSPHDGAAALDRLNELVSHTRLPSAAHWMRHTTCPTSPVDEDTAWMVDHIWQRWPSFVEGRVGGTFALPEPVVVDVPGLSTRAFPHAGFTGVVVTEEGLTLNTRRWHLTEYGRELRPAPVGLSAYDLATDGTAQLVGEWDSRGASRWHPRHPTAYVPTADGRGWLQWMTQNLQLERFEAVDVSMHSMPNTSVFTYEWGAAATVVRAGDTAVVLRKSIGTAHSNGGFENYGDVNYMGAVSLAEDGLSPDVRYVSAPSASRLLPHSVSLVGLDYESEDSVGAHYVGTSSDALDGYALRSVYHPSTDTWSDAVVVDVPPAVDFSAPRLAHVEPSGAAWWSEGGTLFHKPGPDERWRIQEGYCDGPGLYRPERAQVVVVDDQRFLFATTPGDRPFHAPLKMWNLGAVE